MTDAAAEPPNGDKPEQDRLNRRTTLVVGVIALLGVVGSSLGAYVSAQSTAHSTTVDAQTSFLRTQRQSAYGNYLSAVIRFNTDAQTVANSFLTRPLSTRFIDSSINAYISASDSLNYAEGIVSVIGSTSVVQAMKDRFRGEITVTRDVRTVRGAYDAANQPITQTTLTQLANDAKHLKDDAVADQGTGAFVAQARHDQIPAGQS